MFTSSLNRAQLMRHFLPLTYLILFLLQSLSLLTPTFAAQGDQDARPLSLNEPVERELAGGQAHSYRIALTAGQYLHVVADQRGIDVVVTLFGPDGKQLVEVDSPNGTQGPEPISAVIETSGTYRLEVRSLEKDAPAGRYEVKVEELRTATERDTIRITAEQAFASAELLREEPIAESLRKAINKYEESISLFRSIGDHNREAQALNHIGVIYDSLSEEQKALEYYELALKLRRTIGDRGGEAVTLGNIGRAYDALGQKQKALEYFTQALPIYHTVGDQQGEAGMFNNLAFLFSSLGEMQKALDYYTQALTLVRAIGDHKNEALTLNNIGHLYDSLNEPQKALDYYRQALKLIREIGDLRSEAIMLHNIGEVYHSLGEIQKALDFFNQALPVLRAAGDRGGEAVTLGSIGGLYSSLGENQKALEYYEQVLALVRTVGDRLGEALILHNIGKTYGSLGDNQKALEYFRQALPVCREVGDRVTEAATLTGFGVSYATLGEGRKALEYFRQALPVIRLVGDRHGEAILLHNIGEVYALSGERQKALEYFAQALRINRITGDRIEEAKVLDNLMFVYQSLDKPRLAVFYGKQSVNAYQQLRSNIRGLDKNLQRTYLKSVEGTYRALAELLIKQGRLAEAQQVLNAFKDQQFFDFDQSQSRKLEPLTRSRLEDEFTGRYEQVSNALSAASGQVEELRRKLGNRQPTEKEGGELRQLEAQLKSASDEFSNMLGRAEVEFSKPADEKDKVSEVSDTAQMQATLRQLRKDTGQTAVAVYTLAGKANFHALIVTADNLTSVSSAINGDEVNKKAEALWGLLQSDAYDPTGLSNELYNVVFKPLEEKLPKDTKTILWSLDGNLRYVPMAALYDGREYLVERYNHVNFTRADGERMTRAVTRNWTATGLGTSVARTVELLGNKITLGGLPGVGEELRLLVKRKDNPHGIFEGEALQDGQFTREAMLSALGRKRPVVHIASHFVFRPGDEERSFLLMGDGTAFTLAEMKQQGRLFDGVELLTLSACNTAAQLAGANGREIDAFAELAQRLGANAVMATLWPVADSSTPWLMREFYRTRRDQTLNKADALRRAQLALLRGKAEASPSPAMPKGAVRVQVLSDARQTGDTTRAEVVFVDAKNAVPFKKDPSKPFAHPYYWSPFILIGNWR